MISVKWKSRCRMTDCALVQLNRKPGHRQGYAIKEVIYSLNQFNLSLKEKERLWNVRSMMFVKMKSSRRP